MDSDQTNVIEKSKTPDECCFCSQADQGNVCRGCRNKFRHMYRGTDLEYKHCVDCSNCDFYGFPCLNCAKRVFDGRFGLGCPDDPKTKEELMDVIDESCDNGKKVLSFISFSKECIIS